MQNKMNMKNKTHKCVPRNSQINLSAQSLNNVHEPRNAEFTAFLGSFLVV